MDSLVTAALVGTAQSGVTNLTTGSAPDTLVTQIGAEAAAERERKLLLQAGARAIYQSAGYTPVTIAAPEPAEEEEWSACSPQVAELIKQLLADDDADLQALAFERMRQAKLRLAPDLLPLALDIHNREKRRLLSPLLGKRGRWLSQFYSLWSWAGETLDSPGDAVPANAETIWQEGTSAQRIEVLRRLRASDPALARQWIEDAWKRERVEFRVDMTRALAVNLGPDDEALLERALDDKAGGVRSAAVEVLRGLPNSALTQRMIARADAMLDYSKGKLRAEPPTKIDAAWERDGISAIPPTKKGERSWWLLQALSFVPPAHWCDRFNVTPADLIAAAGASDWEQALLEGWSRATATFADERWALPLWQHWRQPTKKDERRQVAGVMYTMLAPLVLQSVLEAAATDLLQDAAAPFGPPFDQAIAAVPAPWSREFGEEYLRGLRAFLASLDKKSTSAAPWDGMLVIAAKGLPPECYAAVLSEPLTLPDGLTNWYMQRFQTQLDEFTTTIQLRQRIYHEIPIQETSAHE